MQMIETEKAGICESTGLFYTCIKLVLAYRVNFLRFA